MRLPAMIAWILVAGCGASPRATTLPGNQPSATTPARDLAEAKSIATRIAGGDAGQLVVKDPRAKNLDIIRITASQRGVGGEIEVTSESTAELFRQAGDLVAAKRTLAAMALYRKLVTDYPESTLAAISLFNIAAIYDGQGDPERTVATLRELVKAYPDSHESVEGHLFIAALFAEKRRFAEADGVLDEILARPNLAFADRIEAFARKGYGLLELRRYAEAAAALDGAIAEWRKVPHLDEVYYIAMAQYYRGEVAHRRFVEAPVRHDDDLMIADLEAKRVLAVQAYDLWKESLGFKHAYWATASGYQMSQIFVELWEATVKAPYPVKLAPDARAQYVAEVHRRMREHLEKALEGHRMNVELARAYGVTTEWSRGSAARATELLELLAKDAAGQFVVPTS